MEKCYICGKKFKNNNHSLVNVMKESQDVFVGPECFKKVKAAGEKGYTRDLGKVSLTYYLMEFKGKK